MYSVDRLIVGRIILSVCDVVLCDVVLLERQENGQWVWAQVAESGFCLNKGPQVSNLLTCRCCRRTSVEAVWARTHGAECLTCQGYCRMAFKVAKTRADEKAELAKQLKDESAFGKWKAGSWQKYVDDSNDGRGRVLVAWLAVRTYLAWAGG